MIRSRKHVICTHCGKKGHTTTRSKKCLKHKDNVAAANAKNVASTVTVAVDPQTVISDNNDADDIDRINAFPLADVPPSDLSSDEFQDCLEYIDDDDDDGVNEDGQVFGVI